MSVRSASLALLLAANAAAQSPDTAALQGQITDRTGGVVLAATISLNNEATGARRTVITDSAGRYTLAGLPLTGVYQLSISKPGFSTASPAPLQLRANEAATINVILEPEGTRAQVNVFGTAEGLRQDSPHMI